MKKIVLLLLAFIVFFSGCIFDGLIKDNVLINPPKRFKCTQTGGQVFIDSFDFNSNKIFLKIRNGYPDSVTITGFEGSPTPVVWENVQDTLLERTKSKLFILKADLSGNITENILIYYIYNGSNKQEKTTCSGLV